MTAQPTSVHAIDDILQAWTLQAGEVLVVQMERPLDDDVIQHIRTSLPDGLKNRVVVVDQSASAHAVPSDEALFAAFVAGFCASGEGYNGEHWSERHYPTWESVVDSLRDSREWLDFVLERRRP